MALNTLTWQRCLANLAPSGTIEITENSEGIDVAQYAYADVNVSGGGGSYNIYCIDSNTGNPITSIAYIGSINEEEQMYEIQESATSANSAQSGEIVLIPSTAHLDTICYYESGVQLTPEVPYKSAFGYNEETGFAMPQNDVLIVVVSNEA